MISYRTICRSVTAVCIAIISAIVACAENHRANVYVIPINDEIGSTTWQYTRQGLAEAHEQGADIVVVHMNTYGGNVVHADSIRTALLHCDLPTVAFVDNNAASAGALIALACDTVYMRPDASMGAATVVSGTDGTAMPDKYQSYMRSMMRATAESHGRDSLGWRRDPRIAEAMVDSRIVVEGLIDSTKVLTMTADEAQKWGYSDGKANNLKEVLSNLEIKEYTITTYRPTWVDRLMGFLTNPAFQAILITLIIGGIYFELHSPGMGFPSVVAITAALLYFLPMCLVGIVSSWVVVLFFVGVVLLLLEIFVIPGFGVAGISGIVAIGASIFIGLLENLTIRPRYFDLSALGQTIMIFFIAAAVATGLIFYLTSRFGPKFIRRHAALELSQRVEDGYIGVDPATASFVGREAITTTDLRPAGKIEIDGETFDAVSVRDFIESGREVRVVKYENAQLYVEAVR